MFAYTGEVPQDFVTTIRIYRTRSMDTKHPKNVLLIGKTSAISNGLIEIALQQAVHGRIVLYLSSKPLDNLPESFVQHDRSIQKRIIFMYFKSLEAFIQKLTDFHNMSQPPSLVIIESLHSFFANQQNQPKNLDYFMQRHALIFAILHNCIQSFGEQSKGLCWSIVTLDDSAIGHYQSCLTTFKDLFYFKQNYLKTDGNFVEWLKDVMGK